MVDKGVIVLAKGPYFVDEAVESIKYIRYFAPDVPIAIESTEPERFAGDNIQSVRANPQYSPWDKIELMSRGYFAKQLFIDTDVVACDVRLFDIFEILGKFCLTGALACVPVKAYVREMPSCWPEINTGVLGVLRCKDSSDLLARWKEILKRQRAEDLLTIHGRQAGDQAALREALWEKPVPYAVVPEKWNYVERPGGLHPENVVAFHKQQSRRRNRDRS